MKIARGDAQHRFWGISWPPLPTQQSHSCALLATAVLDATGALDKEYLSGSPLGPLLVTYTSTDASRHMESESQRVSHCSGYNGPPQAGLENLKTFKQLPSGGEDMLVCTDVLEVENQHALM